jgi:hypothetical protein
MSRILASTLMVALFDPIHDFRDTRQMTMSHLVASSTVLNPDTNHRPFVQYLPYDDVGLRAMSFRFTRSSPRSTRKKKPNELYLENHGQVQKPHLSMLSWVTVEALHGNLELGRTQGSQKFDMWWSLNPKIQGLPQEGSEDRKHVQAQEMFDYSNLYIQSRLYPQGIQ